MKKKKIGGINDVMICTRIQVRKLRGFWKRILDFVGRNWKGKF